MLLTTLIYATTASATCLHNLKRFAKREGEAEIAAPAFGYTGLMGPLNWAALEEANEACKTGTEQSPINIDETVKRATEAPKLDIPEQEVEFENLGTTIEVIVNGTTTFAGTDFRLKQFHFHTPSEHRIGEEYFPLEMHMVHEGVDDPTQLTVLSVLFDLSTNSSLDLLSSLTPNLGAISTVGSKTPISSLPFDTVINHLETTPLFQYSGSLTTPPCAEGVTFLVTQRPLGIDVESFNAIKKVVKFNSRFDQGALGVDNLIAIAAVETPATSGEAGLIGENGTVAAPFLANGTGAIAPTETVVAVISEAPGLTKGHVMTVTEISGVPTSVLGVVV
ncbi:carbonic anhydrase [Delitschia confertaspora ATCC 74209]|uniref:Carbonic anhydrase n=1 Tax=Delitschia confertaspora ATCC 74209 TaxID=1513339 RepID=A0A9P4N040_9PLEO|nr:carbonic anhydrase [Delitschia confertaspora ATCC 74209]